MLELVTSDRDASTVTACPVLPVNSTSRCITPGPISTDCSVMTFAIVPPPNDQMVFQSDPALAAAGVEPTVRPEQLGPEEFAALQRAREAEAAEGGDA
ncbi:MAG TPA: hypothetical protein PKW35_09985 [Nannocystaceae bacterium]|nr:hypothetical protein [Nannocystaceae bacterium]